MKLTIGQIAKICHQTNKAYCESIGDNSQLDWELVPKWQKDSAIDGVEYVMLNPDCEFEDSHNNWFVHKMNEGWIYGETKNEQRKMHPCMVEFNELPMEQQIKDMLFINTVKIFAKTIEIEA